MEQIGLILVWIGAVLCAIGFVLGICIKHYFSACVSLFFFIMDVAVLIGHYCFQDNEKVYDDNGNNTPTLQITSIVKGDSIIRSDTIVVVDEQFNTY